MRPIVVARGTMCMSGAMYVSMNGPPPGWSPTAPLLRDICWISTRPPGLR